MKMDVPVNEGERRLPIYLLLDCSGSMAGAPIQAVQRGVEMFAREVRQDHYAAATVHVGIITFASTAQMVTNGLVPIGQFQPPQLSAGGVLRWEQHYDCCNNRLTAIFVLRRQLKTKKQIGNR